MADERIKPMDFTVVNATEHPPAHFVKDDVIEGKYLVLEKIGAGGMGSVYRVKQVFLDKIFALKTLDHSASPVAIQRFQIEAKAASALDHPSLVQVHDFGLINQQQPYLVMDFVKGVTFAEYLKRYGPVEPHRVQALFAPICFALQTAHEHHIVHRDIKPGNLMIVDGVAFGEPGCVKVVDFGIAKLTNIEEGEIQALTRTGEIFGSPIYMSPEQCTGGKVDARSDVYSLGCVLFEMLTGSPPHLGKNALATMMLHEAGQIPTLREASLGKVFPEQLEQVVKKMLQRSPENRYQKIGEIAQELSGAVAKTSGSIAPGAIPRATPRVKGVTVDKSRIILIGGILLAFLVGAGLTQVFSLKPQRVIPRDVQNGDEKSVSHEGQDVMRAGSSTISNADDMPDLGDVQQAIPAKIDREINNAKNDFARIHSIVSSTVDGNQRKFEFPNSAIGTICRFKDLNFTLEPKKAKGEVFVDVNVPQILDVGGHSKEIVAALDSPSVFAKIGRDEFVGLVISRDVESVSSSNILKIIETASKWSDLRLVGLCNVHHCDKILETLDRADKLKFFEFKNCDVDSPSSADRPFFAKLKGVGLVGVEPAVLQKIYHRLHASKELHWMFVTKTLTTPEELDELAGCPELFSLTIANCDDQIVHSILNIHSLKKVFFRESIISEKQIRELETSKKLEHIALSMGKYDPIDQEKLKSQHPKIIFDSH